MEKFNTEEKLIDELKKRFIKKFGKGVAVSLRKRIEVAHSWDIGDTYVTKVRYNGKTFEWYHSDWCGRWTNDNLTNLKTIKALSDCLGCSVAVKHEYIIIG